MNLWTRPHLNHPGKQPSDALFASQYCDIKKVAEQLMSIGKEEDSVANPFVHVELNTPDPKKAKEFYSKLFQWQLEDVPNPAVPGGAYTMIKVGEGTGGGIMKQIPGGPAGWLSYVGVDDIRAATKKAESLGAEVMKERHRSAGHGLA